MFKDPAWYVKGRLQPTRALGDAYLKHSEFNGRAGARQFGRYVPVENVFPFGASPNVLSSLFNAATVHASLHYLHP